MHNPGPALSPSHANHGAHSTHRDHRDHSAHTASEQALSTDLLIIGGGPAGSAAAITAARAGIETLVIDRAAQFPRDKTCGDGLTPRAIAQLRYFGLADEFLSGYQSRGLALHGFGDSVQIPWDSQGGGFPPVGSACPRLRLDARLLKAAQDAGARVITGVHAERAETDAAGRVYAVHGVAHGGPTARTATPGHPAAQAHGATGGATTHTSAATLEKDSTGMAATSAARAVEKPTHTELHLPQGTPVRISCQRLILAEGVRSTVAAGLGARWHKDTVYGIAARAYATTPRSADPWIHSHVELRDVEGDIQPGYGWIFPLGTGSVNIGCGALSTASRPARINTKKLLASYANQVRDEWQLGPEHSVTSALLPMGGAVSGVAGPNWAAIGDTAACVNPLNGEGIDYALETGRAVADMMAAHTPGRLNLTRAWPEHLRDQYGRAFSLARRAAVLLTYPQTLPLVGPLGLRGPQAELLMRTAARLMGNLVDDTDKDAIARLWRAAGSVSRALPEPAPLWGTRRF